MKIRLARLGAILLLLLLALAAPRPATLLERTDEDGNTYHVFELNLKEIKIVPDSFRDGRCGFAAMTALLKSKNVAFNRDALMQFAVGCTDVVGRHTKLCQHLNRRTTPCDEVTKPKAEGCEEIYGGRFEFVGTWYCRSMCTFVAR